MLSAAAQADDVGVQASSSAGVHFKKQLPSLLRKEVLGGASQPCRAQLESPERARRACPSRFIWQGMSRTAC